MGNVAKPKSRGCSDRLFFPPTQKRACLVVRKHLTGGKLCQYVNRARPDRGCPVTAWRRRHASTQQAHR